MTEEDEPGAGPLFGNGGDLLPLKLVFVEIGDTVDYYPGKGTSKVDGFVHDKGHDSSREDVVLHICIPGRPEAFEDVEMDIVFRELVVDAKIGFWVCQSGVGHEVHGGQQTRS